MKTPETDAAAFDAFDGQGGEVVFAAFARQLERERDDARRLLAAAREALNAIHAEVGGWIGAMMKGEKE